MMTNSLVVRTNKKKNGSTEYLQGSFYFHGLFSICQEKHRTEDRKDDRAGGERDTWGGDVER